MTTIKDLNPIRKLVLNSFKFKLFLLRDLPMGFIAGMRVKELSKEKGVVTIPYKYLTKNPFKSMYFACLAMAAELSSGILCIASTYNSKPKVSTLVLGIEGEFKKKAVGLITFTCMDGTKIQNAVESSISSGEGVTFTASSTGIDEEGDQVAEFKITWSFKPKSK